MARILIIEDEARIASFVAKGLNAEGYTTTIASDGVTGLDLAMSGEFDLVVLDIGLPGMDGYDILEQLRGSGRNLPVVVLTARDSVTDTVSALEGGADDYMAKPFQFAELLARVRLRLRTTADDTGSREAVLQVGRFTLDLHTHRLKDGDKETELSAREFRLAEVFLRNPSRVLSREQLLSHVWGYDFDPGSNVVDVYVGYLRKKVGSQAIATVRGVGYRFSP